MKNTHQLWCPCSRLEYLYLYGKLYIALIGGKRTTDKVLNSQGFLNFREKKEEQNKTLTIILILFFNDSRQATTSDLESFDIFISDFLTYNNEEYIKLKCLSTKL